MKKVSQPAKRLLLQDGNADMSESHETAKHVVDALSIMTVVGTLVEMLPSIAAIFTIVWTLIRIWETETVQNLFGRKGNKDAE
jgi:hypothetical protein